MHNTESVQVSKRAGEPQEADASLTLREWPEFLQPVNKTLAPPRLSAEAHGGLRSEGTKKLDDMRVLPDALQNLELSQDRLRSITRRVDDFNYAREF